MNGQCWKFTGIYGNPEAENRKESWSLLRYLSTLSPLDWICMGDFNEIVEEAEKIGVVRKPRWQMKNFRGTLEFCQLHDMGYSGLKHTWCNRREGRGFVKERLDRVLATSNWREIFPHIHVELLAARSSDHASIYVSFSHTRTRQQRRKTWFQYEVGWHKNQLTREVVKQV